MTHFQSTKTLKSKRFLAFLLLVFFLSSVLPFVWFSRALRAEEPLPETNNHVFHDSECFELYHVVNGETVPKKLEYLFAETTTAGKMTPVYCVRAGAPTPENGSIQPAVMHDSAAAALLGKIQYIIEMDESSFQLPDTVNNHPHIHYCVRQILIWNLIHLYEGSLSSSSKQYFSGIDIDTFVDGEGSGPTAVKILAEAKRLWSVYDQAGRPSKAGAYVPNYQAKIEQASSLTYDASTHSYFAKFSVQVEETVRGNAGGSFRFSEMTGGTVYLTDATGKAVRVVTTNETFPSGSTFQIRGKWSELHANGQSRDMGVTVEAVDNASNTRSQLMYGYFFDSSLTASGLSRQTYVGWHESSDKRFTGTSRKWEIGTNRVELSKRAVFQDMKVPEEGATFEIYPADYANLQQAQADGIGFRCVSNAKGEIVEEKTGTALQLPKGQYTIRQISTPTGTKTMTPNPSAFTVVDGKSTSATFEDEMAAGRLAILKKVQTGYDVYAGTASEDLAPESNAEFQVWNTAYDSYDQAPAAYRDVLTTDAHGYAMSKLLPYGEYRVHQIESEATKYTYTCEDSTVSIRGTGSPDSPEKTLTLIDRQYELKIQIRKVDERTGEVIPAAGVKFQVLDQEENVLKDWDGCDTFETTSDGTANIEKLGLAVGTYFIREVEAPRGFVRSDELIQIDVRKGESFVGVGPQSDLKAVDFADDEVEVSVALLKKGEVLTGATPKAIDCTIDVDDNGQNNDWAELTGYTFEYTEVPLEGAVYELYCEGDVLDFYRDIALLDPAKYPEGAIVMSEDGTTFAPYKMFDTDGDGERETPLRAGTKLGDFTTDEDGRIQVDGLSLDAKSGEATYKMVETIAPEGFLVDSEPVMLEVTDDREDQTMEVVSVSKEVTDRRQKATLLCEKIARDYVFDSGSGEFVPSERALGQAVIGIYAGSPICDASGEVIVEEDELIEVMVSGSDGRCESREDYPLGTSFYIQEIAAPKGYVLDTEKYPIATATEPGDMTTEVFVFAPKDEIINVQSRAHLRVLKTAADTGLPMEKVEFEVYTQDGHLIEKLVTDEEGIVETSVAYPYGTKIILHETKTDERYALGEDIAVDIAQSQETQVLLPYQEIDVLNYPLSEIRIEKHCGDESKTPMDGVTFQLWMRGNGDEPDQLIQELKTDAEGFASFYIGPGEYYVIETDVGTWTRFRTMDEPISVTCEKEGRLFHYEVVDAPTETIAEKRAAATGELLGHCGISVKDAAGQLYDFVWNEETGSYMNCASDTEGATQLLYTGNDPEAPQFGKVTILGLTSGDYEIFEVEAPEGYRNDSESMPVKVQNTKVLGATRLYDTVKTSETDLIRGIGWCSFFGLSSSTCFGLAVLEFIRIGKKR